MKRFLTASALLCSLIFAGALQAADTHSPSIWLPASVSDNGARIDHLYMVIMTIVFVIFVITEGLLLYSVIVFRAKPGKRAQYFHGSTSIELVLAGIPTLILLYLTFVSAHLWSDLKLHRPTAKDAVHVQVFGQQFAWNFRQSGADAAFGTADDVMTLNETYLPVDRAVVFHISSKDVIHSFFMPESRMKQDAVPGLLTSAWTQWNVIPVWNLKTQQRELLSADEYSKIDVAVSGYELKSRPNPVKRWFQASDSARINYLQYYYDRKDGEPVVVQHGGQVVKAEPQYVLHYFEVGCAQLCGTSHFAMRGIVRIVPDNEYKAWLAKQAPDSYLAGTWNGLWDKFHPEFNRSL
jgi:cytochrome c oxidase subunit 2